MPPQSNAGNGNRSLLGAHQNGKGDADRSPGYRKHYDEIDFTSTSTDDGFIRVNRSRIRKHYGAQRSYPTIAGGDFDHTAPAAGASVSPEGTSLVPAVPQNQDCCGHDCGCHPV